MRQIIPSSKIETYHISNNLHEFIGTTNKTISKMDFLKAIINYAKYHKLQHLIHTHIIIPDKTLQKLFNIQHYQIIDLSKFSQYFTPHICSTSSR